MANPKKPWEVRFTAAQRRTLESLGCCREQVSEVEAILPLIAKLLEQPAPLADVRAEIQTVRDALSKILKVINGNTPARNEAAWRILEAGCESGYRPDQLPVARDAVTRALETLPKEQRRRRVPAGAVGRIENALLVGWLKGQGVCMTENAIVRPYPRKFTQRHGNTYRRILDTCFEALGIGVSTERAIKTHNKLRRSRKRNGTAGGAKI